MYVLCCAYDLYISSVLTQILIFNMHMRVRNKMCVLYILLYYVINLYAICIVYEHMYILYIHSLWFRDFLSCKIVFISLKDRYTMSIMILLYVVKMCVYFKTYDI